MAHFVPWRQTRYLTHSHEETRSRASQSEEEGEVIPKRRTLKPSNAQWPQQDSSIPATSTLPYVATSDAEESLQGIMPARKGLSTTILTKTLLAGVKIPQLPDYEGTDDPHEQLYKYIAKEDLYGTAESMEQLIPKFLDQFSINRKYPRTPTYLFTFIQQEHESLREYAQRFSQGVQQIPTIDHALFAGIIQQNLLHRRFKDSIAGRPPHNLVELLDRADKYICIEETMRLTQKKRKREERQAPEKEDQRVIPYKTQQFTHPNALLDGVLIVVQQKGLFQPPKPMKENEKREKSNKYCPSHRGEGHDREGCFNLKQ
ncbi:hypothetical protein ACP275_13G034000 [Erythranthe tilingii]